MTHFKVGDKVTPYDSVQGLRANEVYVVDSVDERRLAFGNFVTYWLRDGADVKPVVNGHLLLRRA